MKEQWVSVRDFAELTGKSTSFIYSHISVTKNTDIDYDKKYKKDGGQRLINIAYFNEQDFLFENMQKRFESAYFKLIEKYGNEYLLSMAVGEELGVNLNTVNMYFRNCFSITRFTAVKKRISYIEVMEKLLEGTG